MLNKRQDVMKLAGLGAAALAFPMIGKAAANPNIVIVLADDFGFGDAACFDPQFSKIPTPNIDRLANEGMRFTTAHTSSAVCTPTRYCLLTGRYNWRSRLQGGVLKPFDEPLIASNRLTIAGMLKQQGYHTACIGKWHLGWSWPENGQEVVFDQPIAEGPTTRGFDYYFGTDVPNYPPYTFIENDRVTAPPTEKIPRAMAAAAGVNVNGAMAPGWKFENILPTLAGKAVEYIGQRAKIKQPFFLYFPLTTPHQPFTPSERFKGKSGISAVGDLIMETDWALGEVMAALEKNWLAGNTLVIFSSDNGHNGSTVAPFQKAGHRVSGPFRGYKAGIWDGGHHVPFVVRWPGEVKPGSQCGQLISLVDVMATCAEIAGAQLPVNAAEDSFNFLPLLKGADQPVREGIITHSSAGVFAIQRGEWKLIAGPVPGLYNMAEDEGETKNLAAQHPELVTELTVLLKKQIDDGRSTPGPKQTNDVPVELNKKNGGKQEEPAA
jgi:arylsulfatase A-like enzyme